MTVDGWEVCSTWEVGDSVDVPLQGRVRVEPVDVRTGEAREQRTLDVVQRRVDHLVVVW